MPDIVFSTLLPLALTSAGPAAPASPYHLLGCLSGPFPAFLLLLLGCKLTPALLLTPMSALDGSAGSPSPMDVGTPAGLTFSGPSYAGGNRNDVQYIDMWMNMT
ncbi:hypothetical protein NMY22_g12780 [Coprinellus aureogranulatus]|nr:hypothetical protein NMY22_g12780 [Coprinellus aureogranulatus]